MERILGIDPGSRITGYGIIEADCGRVWVVSCGVIKTSPDCRFSHRINEIFDGINQVIQFHDPAVAAIEDVFVSQNPRSALKLGQARGAAVVAAMQNGLMVYDYTPKMVKQSVAGYGQAEKKQVQHMVKVLLNLPGQPRSDAADALAVAICHASQGRIAGEGR
ncbi:MAG: crossover junction endodeoxyribonuclease RuvC [Deltaproteobacteria bacterium]|nr:MAG: crossover junction endodeoxyribonuclease RuvC [Deltaproteobacteria bacterium]